MSSGIVAAIIVIIALLAVLAVGAVLSTRRRRLRQRFGPEYDRVVTERESRRQAEAELTERARRVQKFQLSELSDEARQTYATQWAQVQERFVDAPADAIADAQHLVETVMRERGYPVSEFDQTVADLSVDHASTLDHFRAAHEVSEKAAGGQASTEELRLALLHYRELFGELLGAPDDDVARADAGDAAVRDADAAEAGDADWASTGASTATYDQPRR